MSRDSHIREGNPFSDRVVILKRETISLELECARFKV